MNMYKVFGRKNKKRKGFTLIELIVVIAILGILVAIAVPRLGGFRGDAANNTNAANIRTLESAGMMYIAEEGAPAADETWDGTAGQNWEEYLQEWPTPPAGADDTDAYSATIGADGSVDVTQP